MISKTNVPAESKLSSHIQEIDFKDCFSFILPNNSISIEELYLAIFSSAPKWVENLMKFRNWIVKNFGLKTEMRKAPDSNFKIGDKVGIFTIYAIHQDEIIAGEDDKHLNFRVSVHRNITQNTEVSISTAVHYNNLFGKVYMAIVKPFHKIVVKSLLNKAFKKLKSNS